VPVEKLAYSLGAEVLYSPFEREVSGLLVRRGTSAVIGVNVGQALVRQRFTIAHEIGHLLLHQHHKEEVHVDTLFRVHLRSSASSTAEDVVEMEANAFAAELLMPKIWLSEEMLNLTFDLEDSETMKKLAEKYQVSTQAITFRMMNIFGLRHAEVQ
jgi:Zn-dependent peptidase ImmA (M78 family)